ncbi:MAG: aldehyde ferredoxin oxidoreductase C-terminal domain-containing protein, partial [Dehalococcoidales bacterium]|nr:aldehyde ferredoxin oxidoreductase C-terminal domain-containing protein [Dehalococcoidales bacterium]
RDARHLWGRGAIETRNIIKSELGTSVNVVACGPPGENKVTMSSLLADGDASGSGGLGAVMGSKMLKAIAIKKEALRPKAARPRELSGLVRHFRRLVGERCRVTNWFERYQPVVDAKVIKNLCWGCPGPCIRISWRADDGTEGKFFCQSAIVYQTRARKYYGDEGDVPFRITKLCDDYGLDTRAVHVAMSWLSRCHHEGIISEEDTGLPFSQEGSMEFAASLLYKISFRKGIGEILAQGIEQAAKATGKGAEGYLSELHHKAGQDELYGPRLYIVNGLLWAMDPRQPIQQLHEASTLVEHWVDWVEGREGAYVSSRVVHDVSARFFGSAAAADFTSYEEKALAVKKIQDREFAKESLILCDMLWPVLTSPNTKDHVGDSALESRFLSAVTGQDVDEAGLYRIGEMVFNLQRAILVREGHQGLQSDTLSEFTFEKPLISHFMNPNMLVPGRDGTPVSRMGSVLEKPGFERIRREYYQLRGWDASSGRQTRAGLERLGLSDVADGLQLLSNGRSL